MLKTCIYLFGTMALYHTDLNHSHGFFSLVLPVVDLLFLIFLAWQLLLYFSLNQLSSGDHYGITDLFIDIYDLRYDIQDHGLLYALFQLSLNVIDLICIFLSVFYYSRLLLNLVNT